MSEFQFTSPNTVVCGSGSSRNLATMCTDLGLSSVLIVTDAQIMALGLLDPALDNLKLNGITTHIYSGVEEDPAEHIVHAAIDTASSMSSDGVIGFGGGSSMDIAKLVAFLAHPTTTQGLSDIYGVGNAQGQRLPLIQIPTTAGTGSEVTPIAIITTGETTKMGSVSPLFLPDIAVLDAELTLRLPTNITAATGIDAMVHAIEAYTSKIKKNPLSDMYSRQALTLLSSNIRQAVKCGDDISARENMLLGAMLAGQAFSNAPVAAVHALAYPLGGHFHIPHGLSNSLVLPQVMQYNTSHCTSLYADIAPIIMQDKVSGDDLSICQQLIDYISHLIADLGLPTQLRQMQISKDQLPLLAKDAMLQQRLLINNPREVDYAAALDIYQAAY